VSIKLRKQNVKRAAKSQKKNTLQTFCADTEDATDTAHDDREFHGIVSRGTCAETEDATF